MNIRYITFNSLTIFVTAYALIFHNALSLLWLYEKTHISFAIIAVYIACTVYLGWKGESSNFKAVNFQRLEITALGLIGTVVGIVLMFSHAGDATQFKANLIMELAPIFVNTGFGIGLSWLLGQQMALCFGEHSH